jgi:HEAT repeat protein
VLDKVCIGFDKPRPADFNLDSAAARIHGLRNADPIVRRRSAEFLSFLKPSDDASITALITALDDADLNVRGQVAATLAQIGEPAIPSVIQALRKGSANSRLAAADALLLMGPSARTALPELIDVLEVAANGSELRCRSAATIGHIGPEAKVAVPVLLDALKGDNDLLRREAALALVAITPGNDKVVAALVVALKDSKYPQGRTASVQAITALGARAKSAIPDLIAVMQDSETPINLRHLTIDALGTIGPEAKAAVPPLLDILKDKKQPEFVRCSAARNLGRFGEHSKAALPVFTDLLSDPKVPAELAGAAVNGLAAMGKDGVPALGEAVKQGNSLTRRVAINQLAELGDVAKPAIPALQEATKDKDPAISRLANRTIRLIEAGDMRLPKK